MLEIDRPLDGDPLGGGRPGPMPGAHAVLARGPMLQEFMHLHDIGRRLVRAEAVELLHKIFDLRVVQLFQGGHGDDQAAADVAGQGHDPPKGLADI